MIAHPRRSLLLRAARLVSVLLLLVPDPGGANDDAVGVALHRASSLLEAGQPAAAETLFLELVASYPGLLDAHRGLAAALAADGRRSEAARHLGSLGSQLVAAGQSGAAIPLLRWALELDPALTRLYGSLGKALAVDQQSAAAIPILTRAVELGDPDATVRLYLAAALWEAGEPDRAEPLLRALAATEGAVATTAAHRLGRLLAWRGEPQKAIPWLEHAAARRPDAADVLLDLAQARAATGQLDAAARGFEQLTRTAPELTAAWYGLGRVLLRRDRGDADRAAAAVALERYRKLYAAQQERTRLEGRQRAALDHGWQLLQTGEPEVAKAHFAALDEGAETLAGWAAAERALGDDGRAMALLDRALELDPARHDLALLLDELRRSAESTGRGDEER